MNSDIRPAVLIVNDHGPTLLALEAALASPEIEMLTASSGEGALRALLSREVAVILMDVQMPGMTGFATAERIRQRPSTGTTPIIFVTAAHPAEEDQFKGYDLGAVDYLIAPVTPRILRSKVAVFIQLYRQRRQLEEQTRRLKEAERLACMGSWEWRLDGRADWSDGLLRICGHDLRLAPADYKGVRLCLSPESHAAEVEAIEGSLRTGNPYQLDLALRDGRWIAVQGEAVRGAEGRIVGLRGTVQDITEKKCLEQENQAALLRARELSRHLVRVQEELQRRMSAELHDRTSANLAAIRLNLVTLEAKLAPLMAGDERTLVEDVSALLADTAAGIRDLCAELRPPILDFAGLQPALETYCRQFTARTGIDVEVYKPETEVRLEPEAESLLFRIVQEALANCAQHAGARYVRVSLKSEGEGLALRVEDDGVGFDHEKLGEAGRAGGMGLLTMRERAEYAGGRFSIASGPGRGTRIEVVI